MRQFIRLTGIGLATLSAGQTASGCAMLMERKPEFIDTADVVVSGEIANYEIVLDPHIRETNARILADPDTSPATRQSLERVSGYLGDYARFDIMVYEVVAGEVPASLSVVWDNSTYREPESLPSGPYLMALKKRPAIDPAATSRYPIFSDPASFQVLQFPCSPPFFFTEGSPEAEATRRRIEFTPEE